MFRKIVCNIKNVCLNIEGNVNSLIWGRPFYPELCALPAKTSSFDQKTESRTIADLLNDAFLYAVPKSRKTIQKRRNKKFGWPEYHWKPLVPKTNIIICNDCGHDHLAGHLCGNCYERIKKETEEMQQAIEASLKLEPIDKEVIVLYEDEIKPESNEEYWQGKRIVEMKKKRPSWFSDNLLQKTTAQDASTKDEKPTELA